MKKILLMSSSRKGALGYLEHADQQIHTVLEKKKLTVLFIPYAGVTFSFDEYENIVKPVFERLGYNLISIHHFSDPLEAVNNAEAIAVGGGNTFALLKRMYDANIVEAIKHCVEEKHVPYLGWSAGSNVAAPTIRTTNDMPIVEPPSFNALNLLPFQLNPHFISGKLSGHNGESREERLEEFLVINKGEQLIALIEGTALYIEGNSASILGDEDALFFRGPSDIINIPTKQSFVLSSIEGFS